MKPITLTQAQLDAVFGGPMFEPTISEVQDKAQRIADGIERAAFNPLAIPPATDEILDVLGDVVAAAPDPCMDCHEIANLTRDLLRASSVVKPDVGTVSEALFAVLCETGIFEAREVDVLLAILATPVGKAGAL